MCGHFLGDERRNTRQHRASRGKSRVSTNLDSRIILSKFVVSGVSQCPRFHTGAKHHNTFRERVNSVRNTCEQVTQFSRLDGCVAYQILHLCQARAFLSVSRGSHTRASFQMCSIAFPAFLFSRRATDAIFLKSSCPFTQPDTRHRKLPVFGSCGME